MVELLAFDFRQNIGNVGTDEVDSLDAKIARTDLVAAANNAVGTDGHQRLGDAIEDRFDRRVVLQCTGRGATPPGSPPFCHNAGQSVAGVSASPAPLMPDRLATALILSLKPCRIGKLVL